MIKYQYTNSLNDCETEERPKKDDGRVLLTCSHSVDSVVLTLAAYLLDFGLRIIRPNTFQDRKLVTVSHII